MVSRISNSNERGIEFDSDLHLNTRRVLRDITVAFLRAVAVAVVILMTLAVLRLASEALPTCSDSPLGK